MRKIDFWDRYQRELNNAMHERPGDYMLLDAEVVAARMRKAVEEHGIGSVNISGTAWKRTAKAFGSKATYKELGPLLAQATD